jgi:hypothetical protein
VSQLINNRRTLCPKPIGKKYERPKAIHEDLICQFLKQEVNYSDHVWQIDEPSIPKKILEGHTEGNPRRDRKMVYGTTLLDFTGPQLHWMLTAMDKEDWRSSGLKLRSTAWLDGILGLNILIYM